MISPESGVADYSVDSSVDLEEHCLPPLSCDKEDMTPEQKSINDVGKRVTKVENNLDRAELTSLPGRLGAIEVSLARIEERIGGTRDLVKYASVIAFLWLCAMTSYVAMSINPRLTAIETKLGSVDSRVETLEKHEHLVQSNAELDDLKKQALTPETIGKINAAITIAHKDGTKLDPGLVSQVGKDMVQASVSQPAAWEATKTILDYRSSLNVTPAAFLQTANSFYYTKYIQPPNWDGQLTAIGVTKDPALRTVLRPIAAPELNTPDQNGNSGLIMDGGTVNLDGMMMARVVIRNAHIVYSGAPLDLRDVVFVNCTFSIEPRAPGRLLADSVISSEAVTFAEGSLPKLQSGQQPA